MSPQSIIHVMNNGDRLNLQQYGALERFNSCVPAMNKFFSATTRGINACGFHWLCLRLLTTEYPKTCSLAFLLSTCIVRKMVTFALPKMSMIRLRKKSNLNCLFHFSTLTLNLVRHPRSGGSTVYPSRVASSDVPSLSHPQLPKAPKRDLQIKSQGDHHVSHSKHIHDISLNQNLGPHILSWILKRYCS